MLLLSSHLFLSVPPTPLPPMKYAQLVIGPAGCGKSTYCHTIQQHCQAEKRCCLVVNLDPAAEAFEYDCLVDVRELVSVDDVMKEAALGPNGGLIFAMEYLIENLDWLEEKLEDVGEEEYVLFDCPGQMELYSHIPVMPILAQTLMAWQYRLCVVCCVDSSFITDAAKLLAGSLAALSAMVHLELPHVNVLTKCDLLEGGEIEGGESEGGDSKGGDSEGGDSEEGGSEGGEVDKKPHQNRLQGREMATPLGRTHPHNFTPRIHPRNKGKSLNQGFEDPSSFVERLLQREPSELLSDLRSAMPPRFHDLNAAFASILEDYSIVGFVALNYNNEDSVSEVLYATDTILQIGDEQEPKAVFDMED